MDNIDIRIDIDMGIDMDMGFPGGSVGKESACNVGDLGSISGLGRSPGRDPLEEGMATHSSILAWRIPWMEEPLRLYRVTESDMTE